MEGKKKNRLKGFIINIPQKQKPCKAGGQAGLKSKILSRPLGYLESYLYYI
jgi:hypothetical protein